MGKNKIFHRYAFVLSLTAIFLSGCVYITHFDEVMFVKGLESNQKAMQAELDKEDKLFNKLKSDIDSMRLKKLTSKRRIAVLYGEATLCRLSENLGGIKETCIYRNSKGGLILLDLDIQGRLISWQIQSL
ncbi:MAG: hypothetical protein WC574_06015 [Candidatus Omnitrophota bacterium]